MKGRSGSPNLVLWWVILCAWSIRYFSSRDSASVRGWEMESLVYCPSFPSGIPMILILLLLGRASRSSHFSDSCFTSVVKRSTVVWSVESVRVGRSTFLLLFFRVVSCMADSFFSSEIDFLWYFDLRLKSHPWREQILLLIRFSMVAQTSDLIRFTSVLKAAIATNTVLFKGSSSSLSQVSGISGSGKSENPGRASRVWFLLFFVLPLWEQGKVKCSWDCCGV